MTSRGSQLLLLLTLVGVIVSVQCRYFSLAAIKTAAVLPGLNFFKKDDTPKEENQQQQQPVPPVPPRPLKQQQYSQGGNGIYSSNIAADAREQQRHSMMGRPPLPPPPRERKSFGDRKRPLPPPPDEQHGGVEDNVSQQEDSATATPRKEHQHVLSSRGEEPPPPPMFPDGGPFVPFAGMPPPPGSWVGPTVDGSGTWGPPPSEEQWRMQQQPPYYPPQDYATSDSSNLVQELRVELDESLAREHDLLQELQNITVALGALQSQDDAYLEQVDMLTERVVEAEARAASERNAALEYRANCTELGRNLALAQDELSEWKELCEELQGTNESNEKKLQEMTSDLKARSTELEELALVVENLRLRDEHDRYLEERRKKKGGGIMAWLFRALIRDDNEEEEQLESAQELARSTLLRALRTERNNVEELETAVSTLQQNNSAISEVVKSRDSLINELNDRVAVFEEDKVNLKAALRQLQKEIKDEAPKTQKLHSDLKDAKEENKKLKVEMEVMISSHQEEISELQRAITNKQVDINDRESNLTMIGTYVDKLEERLADFALARRDIELREEKCKKVEELAIQTESERNELQKKVDQFVKEEEEFKVLLEDLAEERTRSQEKMVDLQHERDNLLVEEERLRDSISVLEDDIQHLSEVLEEWKAKVEELESEVEELRSIEKENSEEEHSEEEHVVSAVAEVETCVVEQDGDKEHVSSSSMGNLKNGLEAMKKITPSEDDSFVFKTGDGRTPVRLDGEYRLVEPPPPNASGWDDDKEGAQERAPQESPEQTLEDDTDKRDEAGVPRHVSPDRTTLIEAAEPRFTQASPEDAAKEKATMQDETGLLGTDPPDEKTSPELSPPELPADPRGNGKQLPLVPAPIQPRPKPRVVRFRRIRKTFSKVTGIHGLFTPPSHRPPPRRPPPRRKPLPGRGKPPPPKQQQDQN